MKWTKEKVFEESRKYKSRAEFQRGKIGAYTSAKKNKWLDEMVWLKRPLPHNFKWTKEKIFEISKTCKSRSEFEKRYSQPYKVSNSQGWLDEMTWLIPTEVKYPNKYHVYAYVDDDNQCVYVGLSCREERHQEHKSGLFNGCKKSYSSVFNYFTSNKKDIPNPTYLIQGISAEQAQYWENWFIEEYEKQGYNIINKRGTGVGVGSLGSGIKKWTKAKVFEESRKYIKLKDFRKKSPRAYEVARYNGWLNEMIWLAYERKNCKDFPKEKVLEISKQCSSRTEFQKKFRYEYNLSLKNDWLNEMIWLKRPQKK